MLVGTLTGLNIVLFLALLKWPDAVWAFVFFFFASAVVVLCGFAREQRWWPFGAGARKLWPFQVNGMLSVYAAAVAWQTNPGNIPKWAFVGVPVVLVLIGVLHRYRRWGR
jgi:hypothetical protein